MIYFDNAATSFPKPRAVRNEAAKCLREYGGNPGRGAHRLSLRAAETVFACRVAAGDLFAASPERVVFTLNATMAINMALKGVLKTGDHVLISDMEHNAVFRPIFKMAKEGRITYDIFKSGIENPNTTAANICENILKHIKTNTKMLLCTHASNICSAQLPLEHIGRLCREQGILFAVDGAQSAGHIPIDMKKMHIDILCLPGHKGLWGPQGCGMMIFGEDINIDTLIEGGSGYRSLSPKMPSEMPERYEAGTLPTPAIAGLLMGIREVQRIGIESIGRHASALYRRLLSKMEQIPGITVLAPHWEGAVLLFYSDRMPAEELAAHLDDRGFCVRAGFHCAALAHKTLHTPQSGAVRVSFGWYNTEKEVDAFAKAVKEILSI